MLRIFRQLPSNSRTLLVVWLVILCFFLTKWTLQGAYYTNDLVSITVPLENLYAKIQRTGQSPLWAPELAGGYPLLAIGQLGFWYPPHFILRQFLPGVWTLNISILLHSLLAAAGTFFLLRHNNLSRFSAGIAAVIYPLGGAFVGKYEMINLVLPFLWLPLTLYYLQRYLEYGQLRYWIHWVAANSLLVLLGHPQMSVYVLLAEAVFVLSLLLLKRDRWLRALLIFSGVCLVVGLTSFYWIPIIDNIPETDRASGSYEASSEGIYEFQFTPAALRGIFLVHPYGHNKAYQGPKTEAELSSYLGPLVFLLAALGFVANRRKSPTIWLVSLLLVTSGLALALGEHSPVFRWLVAHNWKYFNAPARFFLLTHVGLVLLAALGLERSFDFLRRKQTRITPAISVFLAAGTLAPVLWVSWSWYDGIPWKFTKEPVLAQTLHQQTEFTRLFSQARISDIAPDGDFGITVWDPICSKCVFRQDFKSPYENILGISVKLSQPRSQEGDVRLNLFRQDGSKIRESALPAAKIIDSEWNNFSFPNVTNAKDEQLYFELTSTLERSTAPRLLIHTNPEEQYDPSGVLRDCTNTDCREVRADEVPTDAAFKIITIQEPRIASHDMLTPYSSVSFGINSAMWYGSLPILDVMNYFKPIYKKDEDFLANHARVVVNRFPVTHLAGLYPPHRYGTDLAGFSSLANIPFNDQYVRLFQNNHAFPRLHYARNVRASHSSSNQLNLLLTLDPQDQNTVAADIATDSVFETKENKANIITDKRHYMLIKTQQQHEGFLVLRDIILKGWQATIDNQPVAINRVDGIFRGLIVPAGNHVVVFEYKPTWVRKAIWTTTASTITFLALLIPSYAYYKRTPKANASAAPPTKPTRSR